jgi:hypothetical protein
MWSTSTSGCAGEAGGLWGTATFTALMLQMSFSRQVLGGGLQLGCWVSRKSSSSNQSIKDCARADRDAAAVHVGRVPALLAAVWQAPD